MGKRLAPSPPIAKGFDTDSGLWAFRQVMTPVLTALTKAFNQLFDPAVLRVLIKSLAVTLVLIGALSWALWASLTLALQSALIPFLPEHYHGPAAAAFALFVTGVLVWLSFRVIAIAVLQFFADEIVIAVETHHYPAAAANARSMPFARELANSARGLLRTLAFNALAIPVAAVLFFTIIGAPIVFLVVNALLLGRELTDMAWLRHCDDPKQANPVPKFERFVLGGAIAALMLVPFLNLIAPVIGAAAGTHLTQGRLAQRRSQGDSFA